MTKAELVDKVSKSANISKTQANDVLKAFTDSISDVLKKEGSKVTLPGFGTFSTIKRKARIGRNPRTGQEIKILASRTPKFSPGKSFKAAIK